MPITGPTSYVATTQAFLDHWAAVNAFLPVGSPLLLPNPENSVAIISNRAGFLAARTALMTQRDVIEVLDLDLSLARANLDLQRDWLHLRLNLFNDKIRGGLPGTIYARSLPEVPGVEAGMEAFTKPMKRMKALWARIEADEPPGFPVPIILQDETTYDNIDDAVTNLGVAFDAVTTAEMQVSLGLERRNDLQSPLYAAMKAYRLAVPGRLMPDNALVETLPGLTAEGGRTPDPVSLAGTWDAGALAASLTFGESSDPELAEYEVRYCVGPDYDVDHEHVAGTVAPAGPLAFQTTKGVSVPGAVGSYRVYVITQSGHEAGSNTVVVARPA